jgi:hypothetical protein
MPETKLYLERNQTVESGNGGCEMKSHIMFHAIACAGAAVSVAVLVSSCRAPASKAGRHQWVIVSSENFETIRVIDTDTGESAAWDSLDKKWELSDTVPDSLPDWSALRKERAEREKQRKEASEKRDALLKEYAKMPLEKQVEWAERISVCKFIRRRMTDRENRQPSLGGAFGRQTLEYLKGGTLPATQMRQAPYKETDADIVVWFSGMADGESLDFGLSHTSIDNAKIFSAPPTIIADVKAILKKKEERAEVH